MSAVELAAYAARLGDLFGEAEQALGRDAFGDLLVLAASLVAKRVADRLESDWQAET